MTRPLIPLYLGIFSVMALSNAIVPGLATYAPGTALQGQIFSAYFFGAFLLTLPAGILADRYGPGLLVKAGLSLTVISGLILVATPAVYLLIFARCIEGVGAGLFIASAMSYVNSQENHIRISGIFMAVLNIGLVSGLIVTGWVYLETGYRDAGFYIFTLVSIISLASVVFARFGEAPNRVHASRNPPLLPRLVSGIRRYFWLWISSVVLVGITGAVTALYPQFSGTGPEIIALQVAAMNAATAVIVIVISRVGFAPIPTIRITAIAAAFAVIAAFFTPFSFLLIGALAGIVMIAQMAFLADAGPEQGIYMGLFNTSSYLGMSILPFIAGFVAESLGFFSAFLVLAFCSVAVAATIGLCGECELRKVCPPP